MEGKFRMEDLATLGSVLGNMQKLRRFSIGKEFANEAVSTGGFTGLLKKIAGGHAKQTQYLVSFLSSL